MSLELQQTQTHKKNQTQYEKLATLTLEKLDLTWKQSNNKKYYTLTVFFFSQYERLRFR